VSLALGQVLSDNFLEHLRGDDLEIVVQLLQATIRGLAEDSSSSLFQPIHPQPNHFRLSLGDRQEIMNASLDVHQFLREIREGTGKGVRCLAIGEELLEKVLRSLLSCWRASSSKHSELPSLFVFNPEEEVFSSDKLVLAEVYLKLDASAEHSH